MERGLDRSSHVSIEADSEITIIGSVNSQFIHLRSNVSISVVGSLKSQRIDCISDEVFYESVRSMDRGLTSSTTTSRRTGISSSPVSSSTTSSCPFSPSPSSPASLLSSPSKAKPPSRAAASSSPVAPPSSTAASTPTAAFAFLLLLIAQGCPSGRGLSPGHASKSPHGCAGGGGYGGLGGSGGHDETGGDGGGTYGNRSFPLLMGSGGGSMSQSGGTGGGVIVIFSTVTRILYEGGADWGEVGRSGVGRWKLGLRGDQRRRLGGQRVFHQRRDGFPRGSPR